MLFRDLGVPRSTAASWIRRGQRPVVSAQVLALDQLELQAEVLALERRIKFLLAIIRLMCVCECELALGLADPPRIDIRRRPDERLAKDSHVVSVRSSRSATRFPCGTRIACWLEDFLLWGESTVFALP